MFCFRFSTHHPKHGICESPRDAEGVSASPDSHRSSFHELVGSLRKDLESALECTVNLLFRNAEMRIRVSTWKVILAGVTYTILNRT